MSYRHRIGEKLTGISATPLTARTDKVIWIHLSRTQRFRKTWWRQMETFSALHRSPMNSPHKGQWCGALMFYLIGAWTHVWVNNRDAGDLRRHCAHYDVTVMICEKAVLPLMGLILSKFGEPMNSGTTTNTIADQSASSHTLTHTNK